MELAIWALTTYSGVEERKRKRWVDMPAGVPAGKSNSILPEVTAGTHE